MTAASQTVQGRAARSAAGLSSGARPVHTPAWPPPTLSLPVPPTPLHGYLAEPSVAARPHTTVALSQTRRRPNPATPHNPDHQAGPVDLLYAHGPGQHDSSMLFDQVRWGGLAVYAHRRARRVDALARQLDDSGAFTIERRIDPRLGGPANADPTNTPIHSPRRWWRRLIPKARHGFVARKTHLIRPGEITGRFSHHVTLIPQPDQPEGYAVHKAVPSREHVAQQIRTKHPDLPEDEVRQRVRKLCEHVFPTFLTREVGILKVLHESLPRQYRSRVPRVLETQANHRGLIDNFSMTWLRVGGPPLTHTGFALSACELLHAVHQHAHVVHLDLRLDNMVITPDGVGFVDFGSAIKVGECFKRAPMLATLFREMLRASQIQRQLRAMRRHGRVNDLAMQRIEGQMNPGVDCLTLALQLLRPHDNPDLAPLIRYQPRSAEARRLSQLADRYLQPRPNDPSPHDSAAHLWTAVQALA
ncbi:MAG: hypothetical protein AAGI68_01470 [Planctomycetota bacterium]